MESLSGDFETHITVEGNLDTLADWARQPRLKVTEIVLACGAYPTQLMVTTEASGTFAEIAISAEQQRSELCAVGFQPSRVKIEAAPWNEGIPQDAIPASTYFEHHIKLLLPADADLIGLAQNVALHGAHLSRNARRIRPDGFLERFVTQRCYGMGQPAAQITFQALLGVLQDQTILEAEEEFVVYDSAPVLDKGWLPEVTHASG
ncbi:MAG: hypothetical protein QM758_29140 [Armatimonas sp.]